MRQASEPTVEEILESIKKVIARDHRGHGSEESADRDALAQEATEAPGISSDEDDDVLDLSPAAELADEAPAGDDAPLINANAQASMRESLAALAMLSEPGMPPQIVRSGETSLEGLTRELLRPALAEWLDKNLPPLVERMVAAEIARIVGKKG